MLAAPQPSFSCFANGMSSQTPERSAATIALQIDSIRTAVLITRGNMRMPLANCNNDQNERGDSNQNEDQVTVAECAGREFCLCCVNSGGQSCKFGIAQAGGGILDLLRVQMSGLQRMPRLFGRYELFHIVQILLPGL